MLYEYVCCIQLVSYRERESEKKKNKQIKTEYLCDP